jgi:hypothetical protein
MIAVQLISIVFSLAAMFFTYTHYKRSDFTAKELLIWTGIWIVFLVISLFPEMVSPYVQKLGFARLMDFVAMIAFVVVFILLLHNYLVVHQLENKIEALVRELALKDVDSEKKKKTD